MLLLLSLAHAGPSCKGAFPGECVEYTHFPSAYATPDEAQKSCEGFQGNWSATACPRDATWLGECRKVTWSKHYYTPDWSAESAASGCTSAESGTWLPLGQGPSDFQYQYLRWQKAWGGELKARDPGKDPVRAAVITGAARMLAGMAEEKERLDWQRVREAAAADTIDFAPYEAERVAAQKRQNEAMDAAILGALEAAWPVLRDGSPDPSMLEPIAGVALGALPTAKDRTVPCRVMAAAAKRLTATNPAEARRFASVVVQECTDPEALGLVK